MMHFVFDSHSTLLVTEDSIFRVAEAQFCPRCDVEVDVELQEGT